MNLSPNAWYLGDKALATLPDHPTPQRCTIAQFLPTRVSVSLPDGTQRLVQWSALQRIEPPPGRPEVVRHLWEKIPYAPSLPPLGLDAA